jgi:hypothetical protein
MNMSPQISPEQELRNRAVWDRLVEQCRNGPLPFVKADPENPKVVGSLWNVTASGDLFEDNMRGLMYCDLLLHRVKSWRNHGSLQIDPFLAVSEVLMAIAKKGDPGAIENGFFSRLAMLALSGSLN